MNEEWFLLNKAQHSNLISYAAHKSEKWKGIEEKLDLKHVYISDITGSYT